MTKKERQIIRGLADKLAHENHKLRFSKTFFIVRMNINFICKDLWKLAEEKEFPRWR